MFAWRYAIGSTIIIPILCFVIVLFCPESPAWLLSKGKESEARKSLEKLRGAKHVGIIEAELSRISATLPMIKWEEGYSKGTVIYFIESINLDSTFSRCLIGTFPCKGTLPVKALV